MMQGGCRVAEAKGSPFRETRLQGLFCGVCGMLAKRSRRYPLAGPDLRLEARRNLR